MEKKIFFILFLAFSKGFTQTEITKRLSTVEVLKLSKAYQKKALWFQDMPQYNQDSITFYFERASDLLKKESTFLFVVSFVVVSLSSEQLIKILALIKSAIKEKSVNLKCFIFTFF